MEHDRDDVGAPDHVTEPSDATKAISITACWAGSAALAYITQDGLITIIALFCAYFCIKLIWSGSTDS